MLPEFFYNSAVHVTSLSHLSKTKQLHESIKFLIHKDIIAISLWTTDQIWSSDDSSVLLVMMQCSIVLFVMLSESFHLRIPLPEKTAAEHNDRNSTKWTDMINKNHQKAKLHLSWWTTKVLTNLTRMRSGQTKPFIPVGSINWYRLRLGVVNSAAALAAMEID